MADSDYTQEAERHLAAYMEQQRQKRIASDILSTAFRDAEITETETETDHQDAKEAALRYAQAGNSNARIRSYPQENESQRQGVANALDWLSRKKKSAIKK